MRDMFRNASAFDGNRVSHCIFNSVLVFLEEKLLGGCNTNISVVNSYQKMCGS